LILQILERDIVPNLEEIGISIVEAYLNIEQIVNWFRSIPYEIKNNKWKTHSNISWNTWSANYT